MSTESRLVRLQLTWPHTPKDNLIANNSVDMTRKDLINRGYIIGSGSYVHSDPSTNKVHMFAWFIGAGAWKHAVSEHIKGIYGSFNIDTFGLATDLPEVQDISKGALRPYSWSNQPLKKGTILRLMVTHESCCPPLLSDDCKAIAMWKLPLTKETLDLIRLWNHEASALVELSCLPEIETRYSRWADRELSSRSSGISQRAIRICKRVTQETGIQCGTSFPPYEIFRI